MPAGEIWGCFSPFTTSSLNLACSLWLHLQRWCRHFLWQARCFGIMFALHMFLSPSLFFSWGWRCAEWDWKIDFSHTVALLCEVENTSGADACLFHSAAALSLRFILPYTAHCALVTHSFFCPPHPHPFAERLEPEASVTVSMGIDFSDSTQAANFQLW